MANPFSKPKGKIHIKLGKPLSIKRHHGKAIPRSWLRGRAPIKHKLIGMANPFSKTKTLHANVKTIKGVPPPKSQWAAGVTYRK